VKGNSGSDLGRLSSEQPVRRGAIFVGRLSEEKGIRELIQAWRDIEYPLRIAGDGPLGNVLREQAGPNVHFLGRLSRVELGKALSSSLFLILPSKWYEMFPMVIPEAFSCALPVLGSSVAGIRELVKIGETGLQFDLNDFVDLKRKILWSIDHTDEMARMGRNARATYERQFTPEVNYNALMTIYQDTVRKRG
jgi:glycosyltransferase involved in cell wall biosynthesis